MDLGADWVYSVLMRLVQVGTSKNNMQTFNLTQWNVMGLNDLSNDLKAALYSRLSSPVVGAFLISWCIWNIDAVLVVAFGSDPMQERISYVMANYLQSYWDRAICPTFFAIVWVLCYPPVSKWLFNYWEDARVENEKTRLKLAGSKSISAEEHQHLLTTIKEHKDKYVDLWGENKEQESQLKDLRQRHKEHLILISEHNVLKEKLENSVNEISKLKNEIENLHIMENNFRAEFDEHYDDLSKERNQLKAYLAQICKNFEVATKSFISSISDSRLEENQEFRDIHHDAISAVRSAYGKLHAIQEELLNKKLMQVSDFENSYKGALSDREGLQVPTVYQEFIPMGERS